MSIEWKRDAWYRLRNGHTAICIDPLIRGYNGKEALLKYPEINGKEKIIRVYLPDGHYNKDGNASDLDVVGVLPDFVTKTFFVVLLKNGPTMSLETRESAELATRYYDVVSIEEVTVDFEIGKGLK
jgi:hypothetical protein